MEAVRIRTRLDSETLHIPDLRAIIGKEVEIIVLVESQAEGMPKRKPGSAQGLITMADDFEAPLDDEILTMA